jgi:transcriptional regulator with XRE-family HTH domain
MEQTLGMDTYQAFLRLLAAALEKKGRSQAWLAKEVGMSDAWVSRVLSGDIELSVRQLLQIAEKLAVAPASIVPIIPISDDGSPALTFEEFCRKIVQEEVAKQLAERK